jgi:hypothetical protein
MTLARRCVWELIVPVIRAAPCAVTEGGWQGGDAGRAPGTALSFLQGAR